MSTAGDDEPWSSIVAGDEGSKLPNGQSNLLTALPTLSLMFCTCINTAAYFWAMQAFTSC